MEICKVGGCAYPAMLEAYLWPGEMLSLKPANFLAPMASGVRSWEILLVPQTETARSKTGGADDTVSLDCERCLWLAPVFERLLRRQPQDKPLLGLSFAEYLVLFRRTAANLQTSTVHPWEGMSMFLRKILRSTRWRDGDCAPHKEGRVVGLKTILAAVCYQLCLCAGRNVALVELSTIFDEAGVSAEVHKIIYGMDIHLSRHHQLN